ncbi:hypothetical protein GCM10018966_084940 [Streptomyces yanii]
MVEEPLGHLADRGLAYDGAQERGEIGLFGLRGHVVQYIRRLPMITGRADHIALIGPFGVLVRATYVTLVNW